MSLTTRFHHGMDRYNFLCKPAREIHTYLNNHPTLYKMALFANHFFRAAAMYFLMIALPCSTLVNTAICFAGSLFYRLTVENNCAYKFALTSFAGAIAWTAGKQGILALVQTSALSSLSAFVTALITAAPLAAYACYILLTVSYDVDQNTPAPKCTAPCAEGR